MTRISGVLPLALISSVSAGTSSSQGQSTPVSIRLRGHAIGPIAVALAQMCRGVVVAAIRDVRWRRAAAELRELDDRMLADIGLSRNDIEQAIRFGRPATSIPSR